MINQFIAACRNSLRYFVYGLTICVLLLIMAGAIKIAATTSYSELFRDITASFEAPVYVGLFSQIGLILWSVAIGALLVGALLTNSVRVEEDRGFLTYSLCLTILLAADDAFLIHESVFDSVLGLGERTAFGLYGIAILGYIFLFQKQLLETHFPLLLISLGLFAVSMLVDSLPALAGYTGRDAIFLLEDGAKLAGIVFWALYQTLNVHGLIKRQLRLVS